MYYTNVARSGNSILVRGISSNKSFKKKVEYKPTLFVSNPKQESKFKTIYGESCTPVKFDTMQDAIDWQKEVKGYTDVLGMDNFILAYIADNFEDDIEFNMANIRTNIIDIEVSAPEFPDPIYAKYPIDAITLYDSIDDRYYTWGIKPWSERKSILSSDLLSKVSYSQKSSEKELLAEFLMHWCAKYPDIISGWNSDGFDMPYIFNRVSKVLGESALKRLSPWGIVNSREGKDLHGNRNIEVNIYGISSLDYLKLYKKFTYTPRKFYKLDHIASVELEKRKIQFDGTHEKLSQDNYQLYIDYNITDVEIVKMLDDKLQLFLLAVGMAYSSRINFDDVFGPVKTWDAIIFNELKHKNIVIPSQKRHDRQPYEGAYVKEPIPGFYKWVVSFDLTSLHPMLMNQYNISPETIRGRAPHVNIDDYVSGVAVVEDPQFATAANGMQYTKEFKGIIPTVALKVFNDRKRYKSMEMDMANLAEQHTGAEKADYENKEILYNIKQKCLKYQINSLYGALGSPYFRYFNIDNAEAVTVSSQLVNRWIERKIDEYLNGFLSEKKNRAIAGDTDSNLFCFDDVVNHFPAFKNKTDEQIVDLLNQFCEKKIIPVINRATDELAEYMNAYDNFMSMKRECIASTGFWTAKKRYALNVWDKEGIRYKTPKLKIVGLETVKSSTPDFVVPALEECISIILSKTNSDLFEYVSEFEAKFRSKDYRDIAFVSSVNGIDKYSDKQGNPLKGCPGHVKGVLTYNRHTKRTKIKNGDKVGLLPIIQPNAFRSPSIAYPSEGLDDDMKDSILKLLDYATLYEKTFLKPLEAITNAIGWKIEDTNDLSSFFE